MIEEGFTSPFLFSFIFAKKTSPFMRGRDKTPFLNEWHFLLHFKLNWRGDRLMLENRFKTKLVGELRDLFPGCIVTHMDPNEIQGMPDLLILYKDKWAALEGKKEADAPVRPNQRYYVDLMNEMSFASFIYPENKNEVLDALFNYFIPKKDRLAKRR